MSGEVRGFWGRGEGWVAWAGALARLEAAPGGGGGRFDRIREESRRVLGGGRGSWAALAPERRPRFYGGFAFLEPPAGDAAWDGFPSACFVLPRVVVEGRPEGCLLRVQELPQASKGEGEGGAASSIELERLAAMLAPRAGVPAARGAGQDDSIRDQVASPAPGERARWRDAVRMVLVRLAEDRLDKVVLARMVDARLPSPCDPFTSLRFLRRENPRAHVFLFEPRADRIFFGAAPEVLAELRGCRFQATAVAGSVPRGPSSAEDVTLARRLRESVKDRAEHLHTAEEMARVLEPRLSEMEVEEEPRVLSLARIQHLETTIRGRAGASEDVLSLVEALHPTPAVCGRPREAALELIRAAEPFDRGWYAGPIGWFDPAGDGEFVPALRSAVGGGERWRLFSGAGIVAGSDPDAEWAETSLKLEPALRALAAGAAGGP